MTFARVPAVLILLAAVDVRAETLTISTADCRRLVEHVPAAGVEYRGGQDVRGRAVAPADVGGTAAIDLPTVIEIPLTVDVMRRLRGRESGAGSDILTGRRGLKGETPLGTITVKGNDLFWNGTQIQSQDQILLAESCRSSLRARGIVLPEAKPNPQPAE